MKNNDIANAVVPHDVIVFEGLLGLLPEDAKSIAAEEKFRRKRKWDKAVACYEMNEMLARKIWYMVWHHSAEYDVMTYLGKEFAEELEKRIEEEGLPIRRVFADDPYIFARSLILMPDVRTVYDPNPFNRFVFGKKGRVLLPDQFNMLGGL